MKKIVLGLMCLVSFGFAETEEQLSNRLLADAHEIYWMDISENKCVKQNKAELLDTYTYYLKNGNKWLHTNFDTNKNDEGNGKYLLTRAVDGYNTFQIYVVNNLKTCEDIVSRPEYIQKMQQTIQEKWGQKRELWAYNNFIKKNIFKTIDDDTQINRMKEDCDYAREIPEPSDKVKLYAAKNCTWTNLPIQYFKNSSEEILLALIENGNDYYNVRYSNIKPSKALMMAGVKAKGRAIQYIDNPDEELQIIAVSGDDYNSLELIKNPSEKVQLAAIESHPGSGFVINYIKNPSEKVQLTALKSSLDSIEHIKNPSPKVLQYYKTVQSNEDVQIDLVTKNPFQIKYIKNPSEKVQLAAIQSNYYVYDDLRDMGIKTSNKVDDLYYKRKNEDR